VAASSAAGEQATTPRARTAARAKVFFMVMFSRVGPLGDLQRVEARGLFVPSCRHHNSESRQECGSV
jgi:hypothetical protein